MHITELRIRHFRNFLKARLCFRPGVNTLIGENGSGKTNALYALRLLLDETLSRNAIHLRETDFCRELGRLRGHWIVVSADFADLDPSDGCQLLRHNAAHMDASNTGTYTFFFRPKPEVRKKLHELSELGDSVEKYLEDITIDDYEPLDPSDGCQLLRHNAAHMDASNTGTYTFFFRPGISKASTRSQKSARSSMNSPNSATALRSTWRTSRSTITNRS